MAGDPGHEGTMASMLVRRAPAATGRAARAAEGRTADPCAAGGSRRQQVIDVRAALPVADRPDVAVAGDAVESPDADPAHPRAPGRLWTARRGPFCGFLRISNISGRKGHIPPEPGIAGSGPGRLRRLGAQEPAKMRHRERDQAPLGAIDEPLLDQPVPGR
jgi:hypothetical protein